MSLKQEIETWVQALAHYDNNEFEEALKTFGNIADTSRILFNCGVIHATLGEHQKAIECYQRAVKCDQYLAVAYFQQGVSNFLIGDFEEALANFNDTLLYLRGNTSIDYDQLGLKFKLYSCEVLFNRGLCYIYLQQKEEGMQDFAYAVKEKAVEDHNVIDEAIQDEAEGYTVFSIPVGVVYRPNSAKVKNLKTKDYLGKARLVAATTRNNTFTGFSGVEAKRTAAQPTVVPDDRPADSISFAASNLVKPDLRSRTRQQSEPPLHRQVFPPTPPPESDKPLPFRRSNEMDRSFSFSRNGTATSSDMEKSLGGRSDNNNNNGGGNDSDKTNSATDSPASSGRETEKPALSIRTRDVDRPGQMFRNHTDTTWASSATTLTATTTMTDRAASVRNKARPARLENIIPPGVSGSEEGSGGAGAIRERPRLGTIRTASEPRGPVSRSYSRSNDPGPDYGRPRLNLAGVGDRMHHHRRLDAPDEEAEDEYSGGDFHDVHQRSRGGQTTSSTKSKRSSASRRNASRSRQLASEYMEEVEGRRGSNDDQQQQPHHHHGHAPNYVNNHTWPRRASASGTLTTNTNTAPMGSEADGDSFVDENDFEMLSAGGVASTRPRINNNNVFPRSSSRRPEIRKVRVKVHVNGDTRYILLGPPSTIDFLDFTDRVREKFQLKGSRFRCTVRDNDDGDMITLGDQDDLDMAVSMATDEARREGGEMGKMEVWVVESR